MLKGFHFNSLLETILQEPLEGGRKQGRQQKTWLDNIKETDKNRQPPY